MRWKSLLAAVGVLALMDTVALSADLPETYLRGSISPGYVRWDGWSAGVQGGYSNLNADFGESTSSAVGSILTSTVIESEAHVSQLPALFSKTTTGQQYGLFFGYNMQWDELVVGLDGAYNHVQSLALSTTGSIGRSFTTSNSVNHDVTISAQASLTLKDYVTARARAGYAINQFLPYAMIGAAVGRFSFGVLTTVTDVQTPGGTFGPITETDEKSDAFAIGALAGLGLDVSLTPDVFLRGEWEYIVFSPVQGIRSNINTGRVAVGARF
jgi:outer membrane immunogenic protein